MQPKSNSLKKSDLRENTLSNNLVWLKSFGCTVERHGSFVSVHHPKLREFYACLVVDRDATNFSRLESALSNVAVTRLPDVYLDSEVKDGSIRRLLADQGFLPVLTSVVTVVAIHQGEARESITLERARESQLDDWCATYSEGFGRTSETEIEEDLARWRETLASEEVHNWFFLKSGRRIGVCQISRAHGLVGVYSVTLLPAERGFTEIVSALKALQAMLALEGEQIAYFERTRRIGSSFPKVGFLGGSSMAVRQFTVYRHLVSSKPGLRSFEGLLLPPMMGNQEPGLTARTG